MFFSGMTIMLETNHQGKRSVGNSFHPLDAAEFELYVGLLLLRGVYLSAGETTEELWTPAPIFDQVISLNRFKQIRGLLRFDITETRTARLVRDKLKAVRLPFDNFVAN